MVQTPKMWSWLHSIASDAISDEKEFSSIVDTMINGHFICCGEMERLLFKSQALNEEH